MTWCYISQGMAQRRITLGPANLHEGELRYLYDHEWAKGADDVLWRRSKLGLHLSEAERATVARWCETEWSPPLSERPERLAIR